jgi:spermidine/putrescine transport system permease protein
MKKFSFSRKFLALPYAVILTVFVVVPLFIVVYYAFSAQGGGLTFGNFIKIFREMNALQILLRSLWFALLTSVICFAIAYPVAYILSNKNFNRSGVIVLLFVLPMWINFLLRLLAIKNIFELFGIPNGYGPALIGTVYDFLPFMILPLYTTLSNIDRSLTEASYDLGAGSVRTFFKVTLPLSVPGIISGVIMVFMPTVSSFAIPDILGRDLNLFGKMIDLSFSNSSRFVGSALALVMLVLVGASVLIANRFAQKSSGIAEIRGGAW